VKPTLYGVPQSPFVRKVRAALHLKGFAFHNIPVMPGDTSRTFRSISPLGKIPGYREGSLKLCDSSVICAYLERTHPQISLFPEDPRDYAHALWIEEYSDTVMSEVFTATLMFQCLLAPAFLKRNTDEALVEKTLEELVPPIFQFIEASFLGEEQFLVGSDLSIADISLTSQLLSFVYAGNKMEEQPYPKLRSYFERMLKTDPFPRLLEEENYPHFQVFLSRGM